MDKKLMQELQGYNLHSFKAKFTNRRDEDADLMRFYIFQLFSTPSIIHTHPNNKQTKRDTFFIDLLNHLSSIGAFELGEEVKNKIEIIHYTESLYAAILHSLENSAVAASVPELQCWSHIRRAEREIAHISKEINNQIIQKMDPTVPVVLRSSVHLEDENGRHYNPDAVTDAIIKSLSLTLSMLTYQFNWTRNGKTVLPLPVEVTQEDEYKAGTTQLFALAWKDLEDVSNRTLLFGGRIHAIKGEKINEDFRNHGIELNVYYEREQTDFEIVDLLGHERQISKLSQNFSEILLQSNISKLVVSELAEIKSITDPKFLSENEFATLEALSQNFSFSVFEDETKYNGLTIREWVRGYAALNFVAKKGNNSGEGIIFSRAELNQLLISAGLRKGPCEKFIDLTTFQKGSRDLFDCPLLELSDSSFYLFAGALKNAELSIIILSRMSSTETKIDKKGKAFEKSVQEFLIKQNLLCKAPRFSINGEEYQYDAVFIFDKRVFVVECKNRGLSGLNAVSAYRKKEDLDNAVTQVKRLVDGLKQRPSEFKRHFGTELANYEIVPMILNCLPFSWPGKYQNVYISDYSALGRFFKSGTITMSAIRGKVGLQKEKYKLWENETPTSDDLINQLENPSQLSRFEDYLELNQCFLPVSSSMIFSYEQITIDKKKMNEDDQRDWAGLVKPNLQEIVSSIYSKN